MDVEEFRNEVYIAEQAIEDFINQKIKQLNETLPVQGVKFSVHNYNNDSLNSSICYISSVSFNFENISRKAETKEWVTPPEKPKKISVPHPVGCPCVRCQK